MIHTVSVHPKCKGELDRHVQIQLALSVVCFEAAGYLCNVCEPLLAGCDYWSG